MHRSIAPKIFDTSSVIRATDPCEYCSPFTSDTPQLQKLSMSKVTHGPSAESTGVAPGDNEPHIRFNSKFANPKGTHIDGEFVSFSCLSNFYCVGNNLSVEEEYIFENYLRGPGVPVLLQNLQALRLAGDPVGAFLNMLNKLDPKKNGRSSRQTAYWMHEKQPLWGILAKIILRGRKSAKTRRLVNEMLPSTPVYFVKEDVPCDVLDASMFKFVEKKFRDPKLRKLLLSTQGSSLAEVSMRAKRPTSGRLGRVLVKLRSQLLRSSTMSITQPPVPTRHQVTTDEAHGLDPYKKWLLTHDTSSVDEAREQRRVRNCLRKNSPRWLAWTCLTDFGIRRSSSSKFVCGSINQACNYRLKHPTEKVVCFSLATLDHANTSLKLSQLDFAMNVGHGHVELDVEQVKHICRRFYEMDSLLPHDTTIFLHCSCGRNRSCTVAVALMMGALCVSFNECLARLRLRRQQRGSELSSTDSRVKATPIGIRVRSQEMLRATPPSVFARSSIVSPDTRNYACTGQQHVQIDHHGLQDAASDDSGQSTSQHSTLRITRRKRKTVESPILRYW